MGKDEDENADDDDDADADDDEDVAVGERKECIMHREKAAAHVLSISGEVFWG